MSRNIGTRTNVIRFKDEDTVVAYFNQLL